MTLLVTILSEMNIFPMKTFWQIESKIVKLSFLTKRLSSDQDETDKNIRLSLDGHTFHRQSQCVRRSLAFSRLLFLGNQLHSTCLPISTCCCTRRLTTVLGKDLSEDSENLVSNKDAAAPPSHHCYCLSRTSTPWVWRGFVAKSTFYFFDFILTPNQRPLRITLQLLPHLSWQHSLAFQQRQGFLRIE